MKIKIDKIAGLLFVSITFCLIFTLFSMNKADEILWTRIDNGLHYAQPDAPIASELGDSKIHILKIDPSFYKFELAMASAKHTIAKPIDQWCKQQKFIAGINAGMYSLRNFKTATGYMRHYKHVNNKNYKDGFSALAAFNSNDKKLPDFSIIDMQDSTWQQKKVNYNSLFQSIRMIDAQGKQIFWQKNPELRSSIACLALDSLNNVLFVFSRSPYSANELSAMLLKLPLHIRTAMYLEGGPEASLYVNTPTFQLDKKGSWVSKTYETDTNSRFWALPNVLGVRKR
ncbi:MAG: phosphodiester glycosidase family protein [Bacteroidota bacterium]